jgi:hypothetical protein
MKQERGTGKISCQNHMHNQECHEGLVKASCRGDVGDGCLYDVASGILVWSLEYSRALMRATRADLRARDLIQAVDTSVGYRREGEAIAVKSAIVA